MLRWVVVLMCALSIASTGYCGDYGQAFKDASALAKSDSKGAADLLEKAIGQDKGEVAEWLRCYVVQWRQAPGKDAIAQFLKVADEYPGSPHAAAALLRVAYLRDAGSEDPSVEWGRIVKDYPQQRRGTHGASANGYLQNNFRRIPRWYWEQLAKDHPRRHRLSKPSTAWGCRTEQGRPQAGRAAVQRSCRQRPGLPRALPEPAL